MKTGMQPQPVMSIEYVPVDTFSEDNSRSKITQPKKPNLSIKEWIWELLAIICSLVCMAAVVAILAKMQSQPLSHWTFPIALNATVAIFITAAKSMALLVIAACIAQSKWIFFKSTRRKLRELDYFESASRGPLGSLLLLYRVRWKSILASIGAIATIVALGVDAFAQQVIRFDTREIQTPDASASFGLSRSYKTNVEFDIDTDDQNQVTIDGKSRCSPGYSHVFSNADKLLFRIDCRSWDAWSHIQRHL